MRHDHERWDGGGYPDGLRGSQIPIGARIVFVVDAYHAMVSDRPYRRAMSEADARAELEANAGTQFDPDVVRRHVGRAGPRRGRSAGLALRSRFAGRLAQRARDHEADARAVLVDRAGLVVDQAVPLAVGHEASSG